MPGVPTAVSVASFSVVLAECMGAVALSTLVPAGAVTLARLVKNLPAVAGETAEARVTRRDTTTQSVVDSLKKTPAEGFEKLLKAMSESLPAIDLLLPEKATLKAEFTFEGSERLEAVVTEGGELSYEGLCSASISAGYSALYEEKSTNKISLQIDFVSTHIVL